ncbi:hypothetical protein F5B18DRAFT_615191 [Nemania serpens]|nr:hypothetical protein F5B18DRAFT_615191 [Nemania serpens]
MEEIFSISTRNVDPAKLVTVLRNKFGRGGFRIEMRHSTYRIYANRGRIEANRSNSETCTIWQGDVSSKTAVSIPTTR